MISLFFNKPLIVAKTHYYFWHRFRSGSLFHYAERRTAQKIGMKFYFDLTKNDPPRADISWRLRLGASMKLLIMADEEEGVIERKTVCPESDWMAERSKAPD